MCRLYSSRSTGLMPRLGEQAEQLLDAVLDQVDAGQFQRLEEAGGKADRDDVRFPRLASAARP